jgi:phosphate transport system substrate-binding protein
MVRNRLRGLTRSMAASLVGVTLVTGVGCSRVDDEGSSRAIEIDGSSTTFLVTRAVATEFREVDSTVEVSVGRSGTGGGFKRFVKGEADISNASRPIKATELDRARANGIAFIELPVAVDGITFAVHPENDWANDLTVDEIRRIFSAEGGVETWADVRPDWPDREIVLFSPGYDSGTFDFFQEVIFTDGVTVRGDMSLSEDDNRIVRGITGDRDALGFFGFAYYLKNRDQLRSLAIAESPGSEAVKPSLKTISSGVYSPFSRPLYIYVSLESAERNQVDAFVDFYLENAGRLAPEVGYAPLEDRHYEMARERFDERVTGTEWLKDDGAHTHAGLNEVYGL